jgi:hypothetical protein
MLLIGTKYLTRKDILYIVLTILIILWVYFTKITKGYFSESVLLLIPNVLIAISLKNSLLNKSVFLYSYYIFIGILVFVVGIQGIRIQDVFYISSVNYISGIGVLLLSSFYLLQVEKDGKPHIIHVLPILLFSLLSLSRSGIITSTALFIFLYLYNYTVNIKIQKKLFALLSLVTAALAGFYLSDYFNVYEFLIKFEIKGIETARSDILLSYLNDLNLITFIFGVPINTPPYVYFNENLHNSLLKSHSIFGLVSVLIIPALYFIYKKQGIRALTLVMIMLMRAFTVDFMFPGYFDYIIIYLIISPAKKVNRLD